jgi:allantoate deiminase
MSLEPPSSATILALSQQTLERCDILALHTEEPGKITRTFLSKPAREVQAKLETWMKEAGLVTRVDAVGNVIGRLEGDNPNGKTLLIGSHIDTVPNAGRYDGILGVMLGIAAVRALEGHKLPFALEIIAFSEEEGVRFNVPFIGSTAVVGGIDRALLEKTDALGTSVAQAIVDYGLNPNDIPSAAYKPSEVLGYLEVHIEQGPVLESRQAPLGLVEAIVGQTRVNLEFRGQAAHAGTTPMNLRKDALVVAAALVLEVDRFAKATPGLVATVGSLEVEPGAGNVIPGRVKASLDVRHANDETRERAVADLLDYAWHICGKYKVHIEHEVKLEQRAVPMDGLLTEFLADALEDSGFKNRAPLPSLQSNFEKNMNVHRVTSGAGHDAMILAGITKAAMLFIRSPRGLSHHPDEAVIPSDVKAALTVMLEFLKKLERWQAN